MFGRADICLRCYICMYVLVVRNFSKICAHTQKHYIQIYIDRRRDWNQWNLQINIIRNLLIKSAITHICLVYICAEIVICILRECSMNARSIHRCILRSRYWYVIAITWWYIMGGSIGCFCLADAYNKWSFIYKRKYA